MSLNIYQNSYKYCYDKNSVYRKGREMNKMQSIVLIIILSGCGSDSSLEMCANDKWGLPSGVNMHSNCDKYLSSQQKSMSWDRRLFNEVNNSGKFFSKKCNSINQ